MNGKPEFHLGRSILVLVAFFGLASVLSPAGPARDTDVRSLAFSATDPPLPDAQSDEDRLKLMVESGPPKSPGDTRRLDEMEVCTDYEGKFYRDGDEGYETCLKGTSYSRGQISKRQKY